MPAKKARGIVISEKPFENSDKIVTVFSEEGKFRGIAHGSRAPRSKLAAGTRLFSWTNFVYYPGSTFCNIAEADLIDPFLEIASDLNRLSYASYCMDLINHFFEEGQIDKKVLKLCVYYLYFLSNTDVDPKLLSLAFQLKLSLALGIAPNISRAKEFLKTDRPVYFSISEGTLTEKRGNSNSKYNYRLSHKMLELLYKLFKIPINNVKDLKDVDKEDVSKLFGIINHFLEYTFGTSFRSYKILKDMNL